MALSRSYRRSAALRILSLTRKRSTQPVALQPASSLGQSRPKLSLAPCIEPISFGTTSKPGEGCSAMACRRMYHGAIGQASTPPCIVTSSRAAGNSNTALAERPLCAASSTDRCNTFCELLSRRLIEQGLSRPFVELPCDGTELGLAVQGQIGATRKILAQQSVGVFV